MPSTDPDPRAAKLLHPATTPDEIDAILAQEPKLAWAAASRGDADLDRLADAVARHSGWGRTQAIEDERLPGPARAYLARRGDDDLRARVASAFATDEATLGLVLEIGDERARLVVACRWNLPPGLVDRCAADASPRVRATAARHQNADAATLARLAQDEDLEVRAGAAAHPVLPVTIAATLTRDPSPEVRRAAVARLPATDEAVPAIAMAAGDRDPGVRELVARHPATPLEARLALAGDPALRVRRALARSPAADEHALGRLATDPDPLVRLLVVGHPRLPLLLLEALAADPSADVRAAVADHAGAGRDTLLRLAADLSGRVREVLAMRPALAPEVLEALRRLDDPVVAARLRERPNLPWNPTP
jgi:hypothetical protein